MRQLSCIRHGRVSRARGRQHLPANVSGKACKAGQHQTSKNRFRLRSVKTYQLYVRMSDEEFVEFIWHHGCEPDVRIEAAGAASCCADIPQRYLLLLQAKDALCIRQLRRCSDEVADNAPERVSWLSVVFSALQREPAGQRAEYQHARVGAGDRGESVVPHRAGRVASTYHSKICSPFQCSTPSKPMT